ncbi:MAG: cupin domain-containing protein [Acidimicrobiales bacterium]
MAPQIRVHKSFHNGLTDVLADISEYGYWPSTYVSQPTPPPHLHWHRVEAVGYVMEGTTWIEDGETGERLTVAPGDKLVIPPGALHIEGESDGPVTYVIAVPTTQSHAEIFETLPVDHPDRPTG